MTHSLAECRRALRGPCPFDRPPLSAPQRCWSARSIARILDSCRLDCFIEARRTRSIAAQAPDWPRSIRGKPAAT